MDLTQFTPSSALITVIVVALAPFVGVMVTSFTKIIVVLSLLRNALRRSAWRTVGLIIGAIGSGQIASRMGKYKPLMLVGLSLMMLGFFWLSTLTADTSYGSVVTRMVLLGLGMGPAMPLYTTALQLAVKPQEIGVATSRPSAAGRPMARPLRWPTV